MAYYKYAQFLTQQAGSEYDGVHQPGALTPFSGVYRCTGCGLSSTSIKDHPLPPQNHHQHASTTALIRWQLV